MTQLTLRQMRRMRDLSQAEMAQKMGVSVTTYAAWERCPAKVKTGKLMQVLKLLGYKISDLRLFNAADSVFTDNEWGD